MSEERRGASARVSPLVVRDGTARSAPDVVATEEPLELRVIAGGAEHSLAVTMRTPGHDFDLAAGFLLSEGIARSHEDIERVQYCVGGPAEQQFNIVTIALRSGARFDPARSARHVYTTSSCGVCGKASLDALRIVDPPPLPDGPVMSAGAVRAVPEALRSGQRVFARTGGLHAAALVSADGRVERVREDVGRHNAVDKVTGSLLLERATAGERALAVSGRASFEIMQKALMAGIGFVIAVGAPSSLAVDVAESFGMTLAGFTSSDGFNVYAGERRIRI